MQSKDAESINGCSAGSDSRRQRQLLTVLLDRGVEVNARNGDGFTALHVAAMWGREGSLRQLLSRGADPLIVDNEDMTALECAEGEGHWPCAALLRNWRPLVSKENNSISANCRCGSPSYPTKTHPLSPPSPLPAGDDTVDQSMAETFVSMYLDMTQVPGDLTEVTELSHLTESPSLLEILTPNNLKLPPNTPHHHSEHTSTTTPDTETNDSENAISNCYSPPTVPKSSCVRRLDLTYRLAASNNEAHSDLDEELFTTAIEPHSPPLSSPSPASPTPFLAESLRKIQLRRQVLNSISSQPPTNKSPRTLASSSPTSVSLQKNRSEALSLYVRAHSLTSQPKSSSCTKTKPAESQSYLRWPLVERLSLTPAVLSSDSDSSHVFESRSLGVPPRLQKLTNQELRGELLARGEQPGPVTDSTRCAYLVYLAKLEAGIQPSGNTGYKGYKYELALVLNGTAPIPDFSSLEHQVFHRFRASRLPSSPLRTLPSITSPAFPLPLSLSRTPPTSPRSKRDWSTKTHFNYLLVDPTKLGTLCRGEKSLQGFRKFVEAVFYVGKGKNARSLQHLKDARDKLNLPQNRSGQGVVSLHVFHNTTAEEAFCREACMINTIGLDVLTNKAERFIVRGDGQLEFQQETAVWSISTPQGIPLLPP
ncbi:Ankyrin repeat and LEM domain-containing protein 1 [Geodia barretti]|uniref:Ankyrin repeat and LEM domain-containing protein 1 n=1 Tax=Geodia barretti TaxID=519541 RepID=A0AA35QUC8_GEOBA|nr:Ankyrin repeat and LEM domain-containing protein 1 [Geodia barretti]